MQEPQKPNDLRTKLRRYLDVEAYKLLECKPAYFISSEKLGMIEAAVARMATTPNKRRRAIELNGIQLVLKKLSVIPSDAKVTGLSYGCLDTGEAGLFITLSSPTKLLTPVPEEYDR